VSWAEPDVAQKPPRDNAGGRVDKAVATRRRPARADRRFGWAILLVFCAAFTLHAARGLNAPFGFQPVWSSYDAYNGATWSTGARALRESGPIDSKFGAVWSDAKGDYRYASHPPGIYPATALAQLVVPDDALGGRVLVLMASLAAAVLLFLLLCELTLPPIFAAVSVCIGLSVPMFLTYGTMLDTLMLGFPLAAGYLLLWQRSLNGRTNRVGLACAAAAVCLVAWEGVILVSATIVVTFMWHRDRERLTAIVAAGIGAATGLLFTVLWQVWVYGGLTEVVNKGSDWSGSSGFSTGEYLHRQLIYMREMFGILPMAALGIGVIVLISSRRFRAVGLASLGTSILYAAGFRTGSFVHNYWNYWLVMTLVLAVGAIASVIHRLGGRIWLPLSCFLAAALVLVGFTTERGEQLGRANGERNVRADAAFTHPAQGQRWVPVVSNSLGTPGSTAAWALPQARFYFRVPLRFATPAEAASFAKRHPDAWVVLNMHGIGGGEPVRGREAVSRLG
jgi:hypothetical protein